MSQKDPVLNNSAPIDWSIIVNSVHGVAYKLWLQKPDSDVWEVLLEGVSTDQIVDSGNFSAEKGTKFSYWLGIGSTQPKSTFRISVVLSQEGKVLENGLMQENGKVNDEGVARRLVIVTFR